ncbi:MAG: hypothetical protein CBC38_05260 [Gammaproteobacteria bacterium TMED78]|nr:MAG: hypothetical protein CBC38_05260 [Gammaproteobacteria bacterium TMED78]|tara:strand:- start:407 stop:1324 length:918 start_codon:yes stop_codon:yes gene_type:complete
MKLSRRESIKLAAGLAGSMLISNRALFAQNNLILKTIHSSGEKVPAVGIGARNYRDEWGDRETYKATIKIFNELGGKIIDSAPSYGNSEEVVGAIVRELGIKNNLFIASKVDREGKQNGINGIENSINLLDKDPIDLMQVHNLIDVETQLETLYELKDQGRLKYVGVTVWESHEHQSVIDLINNGHALDFVQVDYAIDSRDSADRLLPLALDNGVSILVNVPFGRNRLFDLTSGLDLPGWALDLGCQTWAQVFLKYVISHPAVTCAIPGTTKPHHAEDNIGASTGELPDSNLRLEMEKFIDALTV